MNLLSQSFLPTKAFEHIISPFSVSDFIEEYWDKKKLYIQRNDADYYESIISLADIDEIISGITLPLGNIDLSKDSTGISKDVYSIGGIVDTQAILSQHGAGATIILRALHKWHKPLLRLKAALESIFFCSAQANVYLTPARNQSTPPHWDTHDLLVLQIYGTKSWRLFEGEFKFPLINQRFRPGIDHTGDLDCEITLRPGDMLYLPRGVIHEPRADDYSVHVALGIQTKTWKDLVEVMLVRCSNTNEGMRRSLPPLANSGIESDTLSILQGLLPLLNKQSLIHECIDSINKEMRTAGRPIVTGQLNNVAHPPILTPDTILQRREGLIPVLVSEGSGFRLILGNKNMFFGPSHEKVAVFFRDSVRFAIKQIPGDLSNEHKCSLAYSLMMDKVAFEISILNT